MAMDGLNTYVVTFNCARQLVNPTQFARHLFNALDGAQTPDILVISLQEVAPIAYSFLGGSYLDLYLERIREAVDKAATSLSQGNYIDIITENVGMTAIMAFVPQNQTENVAWIETAGVGLGMQGMGNKGAVGLRIGYTTQEQEIELTFVAAHLAPMEEEVERRNEDWKNIVRGLVFTPSKGNAFRTSSRKPNSDEADADSAPLLSGSRERSTASASGIFTPTSHLILAGDLNYRTSAIKPSPVDHQVFPQPTQDITDSRHYSNLLKEDQLSREMKAGRTCHGLREAQLDFPPTYKYSVETRSLAEIERKDHWYWARHRWPSWCDRILYLELPPWLKAQEPSIAIQTRKYTALPLMLTSDHRPVALSLSIPLQSIPLPDTTTDIEDVRLSPPFSIDSQWKKKRGIARRKEAAVGAGAYLALTSEGRYWVLAVIAGALALWWIISILLRT